MAYRSTSVSSWFFDTHDPFKQVARKIYELDGIPKLVQGLTTMVEDFRDLVVGDFLSGIVGTLILIVEKIGTETYKRVEQLVRSGVLQLLFALNPRQGDLPDAIIGKCDRLIRNLPAVLRLQLGCRIVHGADAMGYDW